MGGALSEAGASAGEATPAHLERRIDTIVHMAALHQLVETAAASANATRVLRSRVTEAAAPLGILLFEEKGESSTREHQMR